jgi:K+/H+ antiporter YhaU regulatory subunit KhtT
LEEGLRLLRDATDPTVLVIVRLDESVVLPVGKEVLKAGDVLALAFSTLPF